MNEQFPQQKKSNNIDKMSNIFSKAKNYGMALLTATTINHNVEAQNVGQVSSPGIKPKTINEVVVTTTKADYQKQLDAYNNSQVILNKWRTTNLLSEEQSRLQNGRIVYPEMIAVSNEEVPGPWRVPDDELVPFNYIKVSYSTESESQIEYVPNYKKPEPPITPVVKKESNIQKHTHENSFENLYTLDEIPPVYTREPLGNIDAVNLAIYHQQYKNIQKELKTTERRARVEPFPIDQFPFWREFDQSLWPKYVIYIDSKVVQLNDSNSSASPVEFVLPPVPIYDENSSKQNASESLHKPSQNFPRLTEVYSKQSDGSFKFDHYEDKNKVNFGIDYTNPIDPEKNN